MTHHENNLTLIAQPVHAIPTITDIILFYRYGVIDNPEEMCQWQKDICRALDLKGRVIVSAEGINGTLEGAPEKIKAYRELMETKREFTNIDYKYSQGNGTAFPRLSIKVKKEIVNAQFTPDINPNTTTGIYLTPEELHDWIHSDREFYIIDMRNNYEHAVGHFANSVLPPMRYFRELPKVLPKLLHLRDKTVVTVCTGGVRCEKASGFLLEHGFRNVYQLKGGIHCYMEKYPNEDFLGQLYVFDGRVTMGFNVDDPKHVVVGHCEKCHEPSERYTDCSYLHCKGKRHFICCTECRDAKGNAYCSEQCAQLARQ